MKIHIKNVQQQQQQKHKNLTGGCPKQSNIAGSFLLLILKNYYRINYNKKIIKNGYKINYNKTKKVFI